MTYVVVSQIPDDSIRQLIGHNKPVQLTSIAPSGARENPDARLIWKLRDRKLGVDDHGADPANCIPSAEVLSMNIVIRQPDAGQVDLSSLPTTLLALNTFIDPLPDLGLDQAFAIGELDTAPLSVVKRLP